MSNVLSVLSFENQEIRLCGSAENPEWVAADVGSVLGISHSTLSERVSKMPENWKGIGLTDTLGGQQQMLTVTEPGLYDAVLAIAKKNGYLTASEAKKSIWCLRKTTPDKIRQIFQELEEADRAELEKTGCKFRLVPKLQPVDN